MRTINFIYRKSYPFRYYGSIAGIIFLTVVLMSAPAKAQTSFADVLTRKFKGYVSTYPMDEIYVHTDRQIYLAGEDIWFKVYAFNRQTMNLLTGDGIAYFEVLNPENRPVVQKRIRLAGGLGPGQISLPDTLGSGTYTIRTYTNWMKNFMPSNCFTKSISVYNVLNKRSFRGTNVSAGADNAAGIRQDGIRINLKRSDAGGITIDILSSAAYRASSGVLHYLFIQTRGTINYSATINLTGDISSVVLPGKILTPGVNQLTLFNISGRPVTEKYTYTPFDRSLNAVIETTDSSGIRKILPATVSLKGKQVMDISDMSLSVSVVPEGTDSFPDIDEYLIFGSEFGSLPWPLLSSGFNDMQPDSIDRFLTRVKSNWINWDVILSSRYPSIRYKRESGNHYLYGRLQDKITRTPDSSQFVFLSIPGRNAYFQYAFSDRNGDFNFTLPLDDNIRELIIQPEKPERNINVEIENSFSIKYSAINRSPGMQNTTMPSLIEKMGINYQVMKIYSSDSLQRAAAAPDFVQWNKRFYGKPDIELVMDDYIKLPVMPEVFFELMPGVTMKKRRSDYEIAVLDPVENKFFDESPGLLIDGVLVKDPNLVANLDPELVEKIDAVKARYFIGNYMFYGIINVITRKGDFSNITLPDYAVRLPYSATGEIRSFSIEDIPAGSGQGSRIPDFRNTLYWDADLSINSEGKGFFELKTSDSRSVYDVLIQGVSKEGNLLSVRKKIKVR